MSWKERVFRSLPFVLVLVSAAGVAITEEIWAAIVGLVGMWLLPSPLNAFPDVSRETTTVNVSRETLPFETSSMIAMEACSENITVPCVVMHGSAESHVLGCDGWTSGSQ